MRETTLQKLRHHCDTVPAKLRAYSEEEFSRKPAPDTWSKKETLGHLIDSATNNHQRFVRIQFEDTPAIFYEQNEWNKHSYYAVMPGAHVIAFWEIYNRHLIEIVKAIPEPLLERTSETHDSQIVTLGWLIDDYLRHMEHHLGQLLKD
ncbi:MAG TPA: DinB family protein [Bacteroidota bacterium]|nr:DinB family protein [Bacteroidota bacterium]